MVSLLQSNKVSPQELKPKLNFWLFDSVLLESFSKGIIRGQDVFIQLFKTQNDYNQAFLIFKFLDERTSFIENLKILYSMPKKLSLTYLFFKGFVSGKYLKKFFS